MNRLPEASPMDESVGCAAPARGVDDVISVDRMDGLIGIAVEDYGRHQ